MRRGAAGYVLAVAAAALAASAGSHAQDGADRAATVRYWAQRRYVIPVDVATIQRVAADRGTPVPTHLELYASFQRGPWQSRAKRALDRLDTSEDGKKGFDLVVDRDGEYEFSVMYHHKDGSTSPGNANELAPMLRVVIDTTLPAVRVAASGNGVEWAATDDNLDPDGVRLQAKFPSWPEWKTVEGRAFRASDSYAWKLQPGQVLDVRVLARDRAGNENFSAPVQVPGNGAFNTGLPKIGSDTPLFPNGGGAGGGLPQPRMDYVAKSNFDIDYRIDRAGRSGIQAAQLYVQKQRGGWEIAKRHPIDPPATTGQNLKLGYTAVDTEEGVYGFYVAPESGAGVKADPPRPTDSPMVFVVYDKTPPFLKITGVRVGAGGAKGPQVEIMWETHDQNLLPDPIGLEYALDRNAVQWTEIRYRLPPGSKRPDAQGVERYVGQFLWDVPDEKLWKFYVRARSVDKAGNSTTDLRPEPVVVDLEKPAASITGVRGSGATPPPADPAPRPAPRTNPAPRPPVEPTPAPPTSPPATPDLPALPPG